MIKQKLTTCAGRSNFFDLPLALDRSLAAPAGIPEDRLDVLRKATAETMQDADFRNDVKNSTLILRR
jgi:tripartite-type tricarboxylate transporter receptor subunit TctC